MQRAALDAPRGMRAVAIGLWLRFAAGAWAIRLQPWGTGTRVALSPLPDVSSPELEERVQQACASTNVSFEDLLCPVTRLIMSDPVVAEDNKTYERRALAEWFTHAVKSPLTNLAIGKELNPDTAVRSAVKELLDGIGVCNGTGILRYRFGATYAGQLLDCQPHGEGVREYPGGDRFVGQFRKGFPHGSGTHHFANGEYFVGPFEEGRCSGLGKLYAANGSEVHTGTFHDALASFQHRARTYHYANDVMYVSAFQDAVLVGHFQGGALDGDGVQYHGDFARYLGHFERGYPNGHGTSHNADGSVYEGAFRDGTNSGYGQTRTVRGVVHLGYYENGLPNGEGTWTFASGARVVGPFKDSLPHGPVKYYEAGGALVFEGALEIDGEGNIGFNGHGRRFDSDGEFVGHFESGHIVNGTAYYITGDNYTGSFRKGLRHGHGEYVMMNGDRYIGSYENDKLSGTGTYYFNDGTRYEGAFADGGFTGFGTLYSATGAVIYSGGFLDGEPRGRGQRALEYTDGRTYRGEVFDNIPDGHGTLTLPGGQTIRGIWHRGRIVQVLPVPSMEE